MTIRSRTKAGLVVVAVGVAACGGGADASGDSPPAAASAAAPAVEAPSGPIDAALAARGESVFTAKGCVACHYVGREDRLVGPDLAGVTDRRAWPWFYGMVTNPDSMIRNDEDARALLAQYMTPMSKQGLTDDEVQAVWEYLRRGPTADGG